MGDLRKIQVQGSCPARTDEAHRGVSVKPQLGAAYDRAAYGPDWGRRGVSGDGLQCLLIHVLGVTW